MKVYEPVFRSLQAQAGQRTVWTLPFLYEGMIQKVVVKQVDGASSAFSIDIYNSKRIIAHSESSGGGEADGEYTADPEMYRVFETMNAAAGEAVRFIETTGRGYRNADGNQSSPQRKIYVEISIPDGVGPCAFDVCIGGYSDVG